MLYSNKNREDLENLEELASLQKSSRRFTFTRETGEIKLSWENEKTFEPFTDTIKDTSRCISKTITETCIKNNKALKKLNDKVSEIMNDRGIIASYL